MLLANHNLFVNSFHQRQPRHNHILVIDNSLFIRSAVLPSHRHPHYDRKEILEVHIAPGTSNSEHEIAVLRGELLILLVLLHNINIGGIGVVD